MNIRICKSVIFWSFLVLKTSVMIATMVSPFQGRLDAQLSPALFATFYDWKEACDALPRFTESVDNPRLTPLNKQLLIDQINYTMATLRQYFADAYWIDDKTPQFDKYGTAHTFESYIQKIEVPTNAVIAIHGDVHGDVHAVNRFIETFLQQGYLDEENPFKIKDPRFYMVFLGDYVDRGWYGLEVIYTILRLKNENPNQVFMVRGNHEDIQLSTVGYGFGDEILTKFPRSHYMIGTIGQLYSVLPLALYIAAGNFDHYNIVQCCHGGIEIGIDPRPLLEKELTHVCMHIDKLMQADGFEGLGSLRPPSLQHFFKNNQPLTTANGFMWTDFIVHPASTMALSPRDGKAGNLFEYGKQITEYLLQAWSGKSYTLRAIFRGHQHDFDATPMRRRILNYDGLGHPQDAGVGKLWLAKGSIHHAAPALLRDIAVVTFSVAPDTGYGWPFHSFGLLTVAPSYDDWRLQVFRIDA